MLLSLWNLRGILQARILEWVAIHSPGDRPHPGIKPTSSALQADSLPSEPQGSPGNRRGEFKRMVSYSSVWTRAAGIKEEAPHPGATSPAFCVSGDLLEGTSCCSSRRAVR